METEARWAFIVDSDQAAYPIYRSVLADLGLAGEFCEDSALCRLKLARRAYQLVLLNPRALGPSSVETLTHIHGQPSPPALVVLGDPRDTDALHARIAAALRERQAQATTELAQSELYQQIARAIQIILQADRVSIMRWSASDERVTVAASAGLPFARPGDTSAPLCDSVSGWAIRHLDPLLICAGGELPHDLQGMRRGDLERSGMCVPLILHGQPAGALTASQLRDDRPFTHADLDLLLQIASQTAAALEHDQLRRQARRRARLLDALDDFGALLATAPDAKRLARGVAEHLAEALPGTRGYVLLRGGISSPIEHVFGVGAADPLDSGVLGDQAGLASLVLADGAPRVHQPAAAVHHLAAWEASLLGDDGVALLGVPLKTDHAIVGVIELAGPTPFDDEEQLFVGTCARLAAPAIERAWRDESIARDRSRYHTLFQRAGDAIFLIDASTMTIVEANSAAEHMSGYTQAQLSTVAPMRLLAPSAGARVVASVADMLAGRAPEYEGYIRTHGGYSVPVSISAAEITIDTRRHLLLNARDISNQQHQASRQAQTEKLAGMARLTAAIAHEINNPLQALHNTLHLLLNRSFSEEKRERLLAMAQTEVSQLTDLVRRMLELHRPVNADMRPVSVHGLLESALAAAASQIEGHRVEVERDWADGLPWVIGIGGHLRQVFQDLLANAIEAMPSGGRLVVRTRLEQAAGAPARVLVEFADSGPGISDGEAHLIFEPFYSTKRGNTGLGLAISYSIVERHGGMLSAISGAGGTTFRVALPIAS